MKVIRKPDEKLAKILPPALPEHGLIYVPSQFALPFENRGKKYVFNTLTKQCIEGTLPDRAGAGEGQDELIAAGFLVPVNKDECSYYAQISSLMRTFFQKKGIRSYTILPTLGCNAQCIYCYEEGMKQVTMMDETVEQTIRFILNTHAAGKVHLDWFGGEPLLFPGLIDRICEGMREAGLDYKSSMISNGSLITPKIIRRMKGDWKLSKIQISMDGSEEDYIVRKKYRVQKDHYRAVMEAVSRMSAEGIRVNIRCNVDEENWVRISRFLQELQAGIENKENVALYFAPLNNVRSSEDNLALWENITNSREQVLKAGFHSNTFLAPPMSFRINHCMADGSGVVITPDGSLYSCEHCLQESRYGDIWNGATDESAKKEFSRTDQIRPICRRCPFLPDCTGFSHCPVQDSHCRELREMITTEVLKQMVDEKEKTAEELPVC